MKSTPQALHVAPVNPAEQVHVHAVLPTLETAMEAWLLQIVVQGLHAG